MTFYGDSVHRIDELLNLVEYIPISGDIPSNGRFMDKATIDSKFYIENIKQSASFRDIVRLINIELLKTPSYWKGAILFEQRYNQLRQIGCSYPVEYLLFDFCLAALDGDYTDAGLYLAHSLHILGLNKSFSLLLSVIINEQLSQDSDVRLLLVLLARGIAPRNADSYTDSYGNEYKNRNEIYNQELRKIR
jgi:hypothetical protein